MLSNLLTDLTQNIFRALFFVTIKLPIIMLIYSFMMWGLCYGFLLLIDGMDHTSTWGNK